MSKGVGLVFRVPIDNIARETDENCLVNVDLSADDAEDLRNYITVAVNKIKGVKSENNKSNPKRERCKHNPIPSKITGA